MSAATWQRLEVKVDYIEVISPYRYDLIPADWRSRLTDWIVLGRPGGDAFHALLEGDLKRFTAHADDRSRTLVYVVTTWLYNRAPAGATRRDWKGLGSLSGQWSPDFTAAA